jgi:hypothetical protein
MYDILTAVPDGGHSPFDSVFELTDGIQIGLILGSLIINGVASRNKAISFS